MSKNNFRIAKLVAVFASISFFSSFVVALFSESCWRLALVRRHELRYDILALCALRNAPEVLRYNLIEICAVSLIGVIFFEQATSDTNSPRKRHRRDHNNFHSQMGLGDYHEVSPNYDYPDVKVEIETPPPLIRTRNRNDTHLTEGSDVDDQDDYEDEDLQGDDRTHGNSDKKQHIRDLQHVFTQQMEKNGEKSNHSDSSPTKITNKKPLSSLEYLRFPETLVEGDKAAMRLRQLQDQWRVYDGTFGIIPQGVLETWLKQEQEKGSSSGSGGGVIDRGGPVIDMAAAMSAVSDLGAIGGNNNVIANMESNDWSDWTEEQTEGNRNHRMIKHIDKTAAIHLPNNSNAKKRNGTNANISNRGTHHRQISQTHGTPTPAPTPVPAPPPPISISNTRGISSKPSKDVGNDLSQVLSDVKDIDKKRLPPVRNLHSNQHASRSSLDGQTR